MVWSNLFWILSPVFASLFYTVEDDDVSGGGFGGDAVGGTGGASDKIGRNSGGMKPTQTS